MNPRIFISNIADPMAIALDIRNQKFYWASLSNSKIYVGDIRSLTQATSINNKTTFLSEQVEKMYLDHANNRFFYYPYQAEYFFIHYFDVNWGNATKRTEVSRLSFDPSFQFYGSGGFAINSAGDKFYGRCGFEICEGQIDYFNNTIKKIRILTSRSPNYPNDITIDSNNVWIYWRDPTKSIFRIRIDGLNTTSNYQLENLIQPADGIIDYNYNLETYGGIYVYCE